MKNLPHTFSKTIALGTKNGSHKMVYRHFEVMKSIWGGSSNVEPAPLRIDSKLEDGNNANEDSHNMMTENLVINAITSSLPHTTPMIQIVMTMIMKWKILMQQNH